MFAFIIIYKIVVTWSVCETILFLVEISRPSIPSNQFRAQEQFRSR